jgi:hypothetical protein
MSRRLWRVSLVACHDGSEPDDKYAAGIVIEDNREGAFDLIRAANDRWNTAPTPGEQYVIEPLGGARSFKVQENGTVREVVIVLDAAAKP